MELTFFSFNKKLILQQPLKNLANVLLVSLRSLAFRRSILVNTVAPWRGAKANLMSGKGYLFLTVILFSPRKSIHGLSDPSFFTKKNQERKRKMA